jgi:hypothetical protein
MRLTASQRGHLGFFPRDGHLRRYFPPRLDGSRRGDHLNSKKLPARGNEFHVQMVISLDAKTQREKKRVMSLKTPTLLCVVAFGVGWSAMASAGATLRAHPNHRLVSCRIRQLRTGTACSPALTNSSPCAFWILHRRNRKKSIGCISISRSSVALPYLRLRARQLSGVARGRPGMCVVKG